MLWYHSCFFPKKKKVNSKVFVFITRVPEIPIYTYTFFLDALYASLHLVHDAHLFIADRASLFCMLVNMPKETSKRSSKGEKKKTGPKRSLSAYMFFSQANRQKVKDENPDASFGKEKRRDFDAIWWLS